MADSTPGKLSIEERRIESESSNLILVFVPLQFGGFWIFRTDKWRPIMKAFFIDERSGSWRTEKGRN